MVPLPVRASPPVPTDCRDTLLDGETAVMEVKEDGKVGDDCMLGDETESKDPTEEVLDDDVEDKIEDDVEDELDEVSVDPVPLWFDAPPPFDAVLEQAPSVTIAAIKAGQASKRLRESSRIACLWHHPSEAD